MRQRVRMSLYTILCIVILTLIVYVIAIWFQPKIGVWWLRIKGRWPCTQRFFLIPKMYTPLPYESWNRRLAPTVWWSRRAKKIARTIRTWRLRYAIDTYDMMANKCYPRRPKAPSMLPATNTLHALACSMREVSTSFLRSNASVISTSNIVSLLMFLQHGYHFLFCDTPKWTILAFAVRCAPAGRVLV